MGIEPTALAWEARVLPLYDARPGCLGMLPPAVGAALAVPCYPRRARRDRTWFTEAPAKIDGRHTIRRCSGPSASEKPILGRLSSNVDHGASSALVVAYALGFRDSSSDAWLTPSTGC